MQDIKLATGKIAKYVSSRMARAPDLGEGELMIHTYHTPCPVCDHPNVTHSRDGVFFVTNQISCRRCGVFFRPVVDGEEASMKLAAMNPPGE